MSTSQYWVVPSVPSMTCAPVDHLAIHLEISSEMKAPPKPKIAAIISSGDVLDALLGQRAVQAEHADDDRQQEHDREVGGDQKDYSFHGFRVSFGGAKFTAH